jgi:hypothetical protein
MKPQKREDQTLNVVAWSVMLAGLVLLTAALAWRSATVRETEAAEVRRDAATRPVAQAEQRAAPSMVTTVTWPAPRGPVRESRVLERDPGVVERQAAWLRKQNELAASSANDDVPPRSLGTTEARIREMEEKRLVIQ